mgnify:CR=1 FL=1
MAVVYVVILVSVLCALGSYLTLKQNKNARWLTCDEQLLCKTRISFHKIIYKIKKNVIIYNTMSQIILAFKHIEPTKKQRKRQRKQGVK